MKRLRIKKWEHKLIWTRIRCYVDFFILICTAIIAWNIHPNQNADINSSWNGEKKEMIYIFHDYEWNQYILNNKWHGAASSWDYLFDETIPDSIKWEDANNGKDMDEEDIDVGGSASLANFWNNTTYEEDNNGWITSNSGWDETDSDNDRWDNYELENKSNDDWNVKNNQVSLSDMMYELWINSDSTVSNESESDDNNQTKNELVIDLSSFQNEQWNDIWEDNYYRVNEYEDEEWSVMIIEIINPDEDNMLDNGENIPENEDTQLDNEDKNTDTTDENVIDNKDSSIESSWFVAKFFNFISDWWIIPILIPRDEIDFSGQPKSLAYFDNNDQNYHIIENIPSSSGDKKSGINIISDYQSCMTPWWYSIDHGESILAYQQRDDAPDICNIERRICRNGKLSWTYTQQWCYINENYTYSQWWEAEINTSSKKENPYETVQNSDWTVTVNKPLTTWSFIFDKPNPTYTDYTYNENNVRENDKDIGLTKNEYIGCVAPWWEQVKHWQLVQAFKHKNWFKDAPCEAQIRLCSMWKLLWSYTESSCKTRDTSFIDWVNGSPTWDTYSEEKLEWIRDQMRKEKINYKNARNDAKISTKSDNLEQILYILDMN